MRSADKVGGLIYDRYLRRTGVVLEILQASGCIAASVLSQSLATGADDATVDAVMLLNVGNQFLSRVAVAVLHPGQSLHGDRILREVILPLTREFPGIVRFDLAARKQCIHQFLGEEEFLRDLS